QILCHRVGFLGGVDTLTEPADHGGEIVDDRIDDVGVLLPAVGELEPGRFLGHGGRASVGAHADGGGPFGGGIGELAGRAHQFVEGKVHGAEVGAEHIPVC